MCDTAENTVPSEKLHTTPMGEMRLRRNLNLTDATDVIDFCRKQLQNSEISKRGKNFYVKTKHCIITINASSNTVITAHTLNKT